LNLAQALIYLLRPDISTPQPIANDVGNELGIIVATGMMMSASHRKKLLQHANHVLRCE
jgi:hypothetical protein